MCEGQFAGYFQEICYPEIKGYFCLNGHPKWVPILFQEAATALFALI